VKKKRKFDIQIVSERCTGCLMCQLGCSDHRNRIFNPSLARIEVALSALDCSIRFADECDRCGICVDYCFYGALQKTPFEATE